MKKCPYCEVEIANNSKTCKYCGESLIKEVRLCPFCEAEVSETAKKCRYCGEWLNVSYQNEENNSTSKRTTISLGNVLKFFLMIGIMIEFFSLFTTLNLVDSDYFERIKLNNISYRLGLLGILVFIIVFILLIVRSVKTYKILLVTNTKNLNFKSTTSVGWGWIIPFVSWVRPYQAVKDILKNLELKNRLNNSTSIVGWRWAIWLLGIFFSRGYFYGYDDENLIILDIITGICDFIGYILLFKIIERVNIAQENLYDTHDIESKTGFVIWAVPIIFILFMIIFLLYFYS